MKVVFHGFLLVALAALVLLATRPATLCSQPPAPLPADLEKYLASEVRPTAKERATLLSGLPLTKLLPSDESKEVFVFGALSQMGQPGILLNHTLSEIALSPETTVGLLQVDRVFARQWE